MTSLPCLSVLSVAVWTVLTLRTTSSQPAPMYCSTGVACQHSSSRSYVNNNVYCCPNGAGMSVSGVNNNIVCLCGSGVPNAMFTSNGNSFLSMGGLNFNLGGNGIRENPPVLGSSGPFINPLAVDGTQFGQPSGGPQVMGVSSSLSGVQSGPANNATMMNTQDAHILNLVNQRVASTLQQFRMAFQAQMEAFRTQMMALGQMLRQMMGTFM